MDQDWRKPRNWTLVSCESLCILGNQKVGQRLRGAIWNRSSWLLASYAENGVVFLSAKALLGGGFGLMYIASVSTVNAAFDRHRSKALALGCTFSAVGQVVMSGLASYLLGNGGLGYALR